MGIATFAGGCFWCMEPPFQNLRGVTKVTVGYAGGTVKDPTYEEVCSGTTGHLEAVQVEYDPGIVAYEQLLETFWQNIDPTDGGGQFADRGPQYATAIFYHDAQQHALAEASLAERAKGYGHPIMTRIMKYTGFYPAEEHHQGYAKKNPVRYALYKAGSGRSSYLKEKTRRTHEQRTGEN